MGDTLTFGAWVKRRRKELGLTQEKLALAAHCSWDMVRKIESGSARPSKSMAEGLLAALEVPVEAHAALVHLARGGRAAEPQTEPQQQAAVAVATVTPAVFQLPDPPTTFVGREDAISAIVTRLREPGVRLLTLSGPGGVGKTRLALQVARASGEDYTDGAYFVDLAPLNDPALVGAAIARTLGLSEAPGESPLETLSNGLRGKNVLLLLDNFEQVLDAASLVAGLLQAAPRVKMLLTSRTPLHIYAEKEFAVGPLSLPGLDPPPTVEQLRASEAVQLFVERATAVKADFALTAANALAVAQVCARLDGLPLAIELAAARSKLLPPAALLARLDARLRLLTGGARDLPARQQTLRSAIDWSYDLLDPVEKQLFSRLAVFSGGATLEAIEAIAAVAPDLPLDALDGVESLLDKSLLRASETAAGEPRFWMLETISEYAAERLRESGVADDVRAAHATYYLALADTAQAQLLGPEQHGWLQRLGDETANFREVFAWAGHSGDIALGLRLAVALWRYWQMRGTINEGRGWLEPLLQRADDVPLALRAAALQGAGSLAWNQGDYHHADDFLTRSLVLQRQLNDPAAIATVLMPLGNTKRDLGEYEQAAACYAEAQSTYRRIGNLRGIAVTLNNQGIMARRQGDYQRSIAMCEESLAIRRQLGDSWGISISLMMIGEGAAAQGDYRRAKVYLGESLEIRRRLDDNRGIAEVVYMLAHVAGKLGDQEERLRYYVESLRLYRGMGDMVSTGNCLQALAPLVADRGQPRLAALLFGAAEQLIASRGGQLWSDEVATINRAFARLRDELGDDGFDAAFAAGAALSADEAISTALAALGQ